MAKAELMEELPKDRVERRRREREAVFAALRRIREKPEAERTPEEQRAVSFPHLPVGEDRADHDDIGIKRYERYYSAPSALHQPFAALFRTTPEIAVALVRDLANHAVEGWRQNEDLRGADTPVPVKLRFPWGEQGFWGDTRHYDWFTIDASPEPLNCAFLALRHWAFKELDAGRPVDEVIRAVIEGNTCYGVLGLALALALETFHVSETVLPVVTCQRLWHDDLRRFVQEDTRGIDLLGRGLQLGLEGDRAAAKEYLDSRHSRRREVRNLAMRFVTDADSALAERFSTLLARFPDDLPYTTGGQRDDDRYTAYLRKQALRWAELGDIENYRQMEVDGEPAGIAFQSPTARTEQEERQLESNEAFFEENRLIGWATRCLRAGTVVEGESMEDAIRLAKERDRATLFEERRDAEHHSPQTAVSAVAAVALLNEDLSASDREWGWDVMTRIEAMREPAGARPGSRIPWYPAGHLVAALAGDRRAEVPRADSEARLLRLTIHLDEDVARLAFAHLLADEDPHVQWVAGRLVLALSVRPRPDWTREDAGTEAAEARRRDGETARRRGCAQGAPWTRATVARSACAMGEGDSTAGLRRAFPRVGGVGGSRSVFRRGSRSETVGHVSRGNVVPVSGLHAPAARRSGTACWLDCGEAASGLGSSPG